MATKDLKDLQSKAYGNTSTVSNNEETPHNEPSIIKDRNNLAEDGYLDGLWASQDYLNGMKQGLRDGISSGRTRLIHQFRNDLTTIRKTPLVVDLNLVCDNFPVIENKPIFQLPEGN
jgi:hypothetical protein